MFVGKALLYYYFFTACFGYLLELPCEAILTLTNIQNMCLEVLNTMFMHNFWLTVSSWKKFQHSQIIIITIYVIVLSVSIKRIDIANLFFIPENSK